MTNDSNGLTGNGDWKQLRDDSSHLPVKQLPIAEVDALAMELVEEYFNPKFFKWYCGVIYQFGFEQVAEWRSKAAAGISPGGLFGYYVKQARAKADSSANNKPEQHSDTVHPVRGNETDEELSRNIDETLQPIDISAWDSAIGHRPGVNDD